MDSGKEMFMEETTHEDGNQHEETTHEDGNQHEETTHEDGNQHEETTHEDGIQHVETPSPDYYCDEDCVSRDTSRNKTIIPTLLDGYKPMDTAGNAMMEDIARKSMEKCGIPSIKERHCAFVSGQSGASKTTDILRMVENWLRTGKIKKALYISPRIIATIEAHIRVKKMHLERVKCAAGLRPMKNKIEARLLFTEIKEPMADFTEKIETAIAFLPAKGTAMFDCCVVNSLYKVKHENYDMIIVDECVIALDNMFMGFGGFAAASRYLYVDPKTMLFRLVQSTEHVYFIDAAWTVGALKYYRHLYDGPNKPVDKKLMQAVVWHDVDDEKAKLQNEWRTGSKMMQQMTLYANGRIKLSVLRMYTPVFYTVFDSSQKTPIFTRIVEYVHPQKLEYELFRAALDGKRVIVYCSTACRARRLHSDILSNVEGVDACLLTNKTNFVCGWRENMEEISKRRLVFVTSCMTGASFEEIDEFDEAFLFLEILKNGARLNDMIHTAATARMVSSKTLRYSVRTSGTSRVLDGSGIPLDVINAEWIAERVRMVNNIHHDNMCKSLPNARAETSRELTAAFAHTTTQQLVYKEPDMTTVEDEAPSVWKKMKRVAQLQRRDVDSQLDEKLAYIFPTAPKKIAKGNAKPHDVEKWAVDKTDVVVVRSRNGKCAFPYRKRKITYDEGVNGNKRRRR